MALTSPALFFCSGPTPMAGTNAWYNNLKERMVYFAESFRGFNLYLAYSEAEALWQPDEADESD